MQVYVLTDCAAEENYTPFVFIGKDAEEKAKATLKQLYENYTAEEDCISEANIWETSAEIIYTDDTYNRLDIFLVEAEEN